MRKAQALYRMVKEVKSEAEDVELSIINFMNDNDDLLRCENLALHYAICNFNQVQIELKKALRHIGEINA